jgi:hypothetical protein
LPWLEILFVATGDRIIAGATNQITMPVNVLPLVGKKLKISGSLKVKMTDFEIDPPSIAPSADVIRIGNEVKLSFDWMLIQRNSGSESSMKN